MHPNLPNHSNLCTGCGACMAICPVEAISHIIDREGFYRPLVDKNICVHCGKCEKACPVIHDDESQLDKHMKDKAYAAQASSDEVLEKSSSGAISPLLASYVIEQGGKVCGCAWNDDYKSVHHQVIDQLSQLDVLLESKYLQSVIETKVYQDIYDCIKSRRLLLFCGTPCQISSVRSYLIAKGVSSEYLENLISVSLICHGVPSPVLWKRYIDELEKKHQSSVVDVHFRMKKPSWEKFSQAIIFADESVEINPLDCPSVYMRLFLLPYNLVLRRSCSFCKAKNTYQADITIGDFWGVERTLPYVDATQLGIIKSKGISCVIIHSECGHKLFDRIRSKLNHIYPSTPTVVQEGNILWHNNLCMHEQKRKIFFLLSKFRMKLDTILYIIEYWSSIFLSFKIRASRILRRIR